MATLYMSPDLQKSFQLFPNNETYRLKWLDNQKYLNERGINAKNTGGWVVPGGEFMNDFKFSVFSR